MTGRPPGAIRWTVLGCAGTWPGPGGVCSGYLVEAGGRRLWVDCGPGTLARLCAHVDPRTVDAVVVTHHHPDHCLDLALFRNACRYGIGRDGVPVWGPATTRRRLEQLFDDGFGSTFAWTDVDDGDVATVGDLTVRFAATDHPPTTLAVAVSVGDPPVTVAYTADTGPRFSPAAFGVPVDLLVAEATLEVAEEGRVQHLSARQAGTMAAEVGAGALVLTHLPPGADARGRRREARAVYDGPVDVAVADRAFLAG